MTCHKLLCNGVLKTCEITYLGFMWSLWDGFFCNSRSSSCILEFYVIDLNLDGFFLHLHDLVLHTGKVKFIFNVKLHNLSVPSTSSLPFFFKLRSLHLLIAVVYLSNWLRSCISLWPTLSCGLFFCVVLGGSREAWKGSREG